MSTQLDAHYRQVVLALKGGRLVPLLGAGVNVCGRPSDVPWELGRYLPSGAELASHLADYFDYPVGEQAELVRVSEYVSVTTGTGPLYEELHKLFDADYPTTALHRLLATIPAASRQPPGFAYPIILTTNYDDALERAFHAAGEEYDLVVYVADGEASGKFLHRPPGGKAEVIKRPNKYLAVSPAKRPVILKIHGAIDRRQPENDSFVITEDHYIDYLTRTDISSLLPVNLVDNLMRRGQFLFLGYSMQDWNLRVILRRIWEQRNLSYKSWAIQLDPGEMEQEFWRKRGVDILKVPLDEYVAGLSAHLTQEFGEMEAVG